MKSIKAVEAEASETIKANFEMVRKRLGRIPSMYKVMANSPAVLDSYIKFSGALSAGTLGNKMSELIALATAESNACSYCLSAHSFLGKKVGLSEEEIASGRVFLSANEKKQVGLLFAKKILENPREISNADILPLREAGYTDGDILEIIANVVRNIFTNYINIVSETEIDWPVVVRPLKPSAV